ncbi:MAG TPA: serine hydrolase domain-containing protein [Kofleriaceae bacterium]
MKAHPEIIGYVGLIARGDDIEVTTHGVRERDTPTPVDRHSIFRISSITKPILAATALRLVEDELLDLDAPIERYAPELANRRVLRTFDSELDDTEPAHRSPTVRELLTFTWGFGVMMRRPGSTPIQRAYEALPLCQGRPPMPSLYAAPDEWMKHLGTLPLMHQPGARWMYHTGAEVAGVVVARAAKKSLGEVMHERVLEPLGMRDTSFVVPVAKRARFTAAYDHDNSLYDPIDGEWMRAVPFESGAGGLVSTVDDLLAFGRAMQTDRSLDEIHRDHLTEAQRMASLDFVGLLKDHTWGLGCCINLGTDEAGGPGTFGWDGGLGQVFRVDPNRNVIGALLTNRAMGSPEPPTVFKDFWESSHRPIS